MITVIVSGILAVVLLGLAARFVIALPVLIFSPFNDHSRGLWIGLIIFLLGIVCGIVFIVNLIHLIFRG